MMRIILVYIFVALMSDLAVVSAEKAANIYRNITSAVKKCKFDYDVNNWTYNMMIVTRRIPKADNVKCMLECYMAEIGQYNEGEFDLELMKRLNMLTWKRPTYVKKANAIDEKCVSEVSAYEMKSEEIAECQRVYEMFCCYLREIKAARMPRPMLSSKLF